MTIRVIHPHTGAHPQGAQALSWVKTRPCESERAFSGAGMSPLHLLGRKALVFSCSLGPSSTEGCAGRFPAGCKPGSEEEQEQGRLPLPQHPLPLEPKQLVVWKPVFWWDVQRSSAGVVHEVSCYQNLQTVLRRKTYFPDWLFLSGLRFILRASGFAFRPFEVSYAVL